MKEPERQRDYLSFVHRELPRPKPDPESPLVLDLFAGCGGLALGFEVAGFRTIGYEMDPDAAATYRTNLHGECHAVFLEPGHDLCEHADVIVGGPPCQPFSVGGLQNGPRDSRDGFPVFLDAVDRYRPKVAIFENVRGMLYRNRDYLHAVIAELESLTYIVHSRILSAVNYGVPQKRERLFVVAHRQGWEWPSLTNSPRPFTVGEALGSSVLSVPEGSKFLTPSMDDYVARYEAKSKCIRPRDLHLDQPSRTVTCRNLHGATGDMLRIKLRDGRRRRLTVREGARLQGFPDWFEFSGSEGRRFQQIGNAVPPMMAKAIALSVERSLQSQEIAEARIRARRQPQQTSLHFT